MNRIFVATTLSLAIAGCATPPSQQELESADYGAYPVSYEQIIKNRMSTILKDPDSAQYRFLNTPKTGWNSFGGKKFGYIVCVNINAKNSYGGYVGYRMSYFMIKNDLIIDSAHGDGSYGDSFVQGMCKHFI